MKDFIAPCGHKGEPIVGTFVLCRICDGKPKVDPLQEQLEKLFTANPVPALKKWHLVRPADRLPALVVDEFDGVVDLAMTSALHSALVNVQLTILDRYPPSISMKAWNHISGEIRAGSGRPPFDILSGFLKSMADNSLRIAGVPCEGWTPVFASIGPVHGRRRLEIRIDTPRGEHCCIDFF